MKKRLLASLLSLAMVLTLLPTAALAMENEPDTGNPPQECICETLCTEEAVNTECPVCAEDISACTGAVPEEEPAEPACAKLSGCVDGAHDAECPLYVAGSGESEVTDEGKPDSGNPEPTGTDEPLSDENTENTLPQEPSVVEPTPAEPEMAEDETNTLSCTCGAEGNESNVTWKLEQNKQGEDDPTYTLTISGTGAMADYSGATNTPWYEYLSANSGLVTNYNGRSFANITKIVVSNGVTRIGNNAFAFTKVSEIEIADSVESIGNDAFLWDCWLKEITIPSSVTNMHYSEENGKITYYNPFNGTFNLERMEIEGTGSPYQTVQGGILLGPVSNQSSEWMVINCPDNLGNGTMIVTSAFPNNTTKIGTNSFNGCRNLKEIELPDTITSIDSWAFSKCYDLESFEVPANVTEIPDHAFTGCAALETMDLNNVKTIGEYAFDQVQATEGDNETYKVGLTSIDLTNVKRIEKYAFNHAQLTRVDLPDNIVLENYAFVDCAALEEIHFLGSYTVDETDNGTEDPFVRCGAIETVTFANNSTVDISSNIFQDCTALKEIDLSNVELVDNVIGNSAFIGCTGLEKVLLPEGLARIEWRAFYNTALDSITLPSSVNFIAQGAFGTETDGKIISTINASAIKSITTEGVSDHPFVDGENVTFYFGNQTVANTLEAKIAPYNETWSGIVGITNGGTFVETTNFTASTLESPVKNGYIFDGWYTQDGSENGNWGDDVTTPQAGNTYYAKWSPVSDYDIGDEQETVNLKMDSGESGVSATVSVETPSGGSIAKVEVSDLSVLSAEIGEDGKTVIITPKSNLAAGTYTETVYVYAADGNDGAPGSTHWITVTLDVNEAPVTPPDDRPSSGGSSSSSTRYTVSVEDTDNGSIRVSPTRAERGDTVTITVDPDTGYELDELVVTDSDGDEISVRDRGDGKYTFTMPRGRVTVEATFAEIVEEPEALPFVDVPTGAYYYDAVAWAVENGVTNGTSATTFGPDVTCTRAQMVTFLWRAAGSPKPESTVNPFTDVSASAYYYDAVLWAVEQGITNGTSATTFSPNATVTRGQTVTFLWRNAGSPASSGSTFTDVAADAYYTAAVTWAASEGITSGTSASTFSPDSDCTRGQIVTFLYRYMG